MLLIKPGAWSVIIILLWKSNVALSSSSKPQVQWISPSAGDVFGPGDSIIGKWTTNTAVVSPNFKVCPGEPRSSLGSRSDGSENESNDSCGSKVYPTVQQSAGTYTISLAVPNITTEQTWYLEMSDDFDNVWPSPSFSLSSNGASGVPSVAGAQAPLSAQAPTTTSASTSTVTTSALPLPVVNPESDSSASVATMLATRTPPPTAAFAVPLSIVGAILLVAVFLSLKHNRKLAEERAQDVEKLVLSRKSSVASSFKSGFSRQSDIEHALNVISKAQSQGKVKAMPVPLFMPVEVPVPKREARRSTREAYLPERFTEYHRPRQEQRCQRLPSYRTDPAFTVPRSQSRARSLLSSVSSNSRASSRTAVHPPSHQCFEHGRQSRSYKSSLQAVSPLQSSEYEYRSHNHRDYDQHSVLPYPTSRYERREEDIECATQSVLGDYLPEHHSSKPPECLIPAPQRLYVRNNSAMSSNSCAEDEEMTEVDLYGAVADSLSRARRH
ncbi:hypothetical protein DFH05DRAFT_172092 [Lentinula detonsa]|uniref:Uncharacterized protein n=1 Tax=Lentinula detonsa TaxID=2804962 RepID=A0A9W8PCH3_9AGAR|nr:hypothetical protein DFH05DRAFT_172092 [Lentinula detonsa]